MPQNAREILDTMLGYLGFVCDIKEFDTPNGPVLQIYTPERDRLIGRHGPGTDGHRRQADGARDGLPQIELTVRLRSAPLHQISLHFFPFFHSLSPSSSALENGPSSPADR